MGLAAGALVEGWRGACGWLVGRGMSGKPTVSLGGGGRWGGALPPAKKKWLLEQRTKLEGDLRRTMQELNRETDAALADNKRKQV